MTAPLTFIQYGLGPIGVRIVAAALERPGLQVAGAIDIDPAKAGKDLGELLERGPLGVRVQADARAVLTSSDAPLVVLSTVSTMEQAAPQILECIRCGKHVVSSTEELAYPWRQNPELARQIDGEAREHRVCVLGTGVNPGFVMDALPIMLTAACRRVSRVTVRRHQDAAIRRLPFQHKIGAGLSPEAFEERVAQKRIRHVGFTESLQMIAGRLNWALEHTEDVVTAVIAERAVASEHIRVPAGAVAGVCQTARGFIGDRAVITLELQAYLGHPAPADRVEIEGEPDIVSEIKGGLNGDIATAAMAVNAMPQVLAAPPGLRTMADLGLVSWFAGR